MLEKMKKEKVAKKTTSFNWDKKGLKNPFISEGKIITIWCNNQMI